MINFNIFLFNDFEVLDVFGPVEIIGKLDDVYNINYFSIEGGIVTSKQKTKILTQAYKDIGFSGILLIPGGQGTRKIVNDENTILILKEISQKSAYCITVCTGTALLAKTGLINGIKATSNKKAFEWVTSINKNVIWVRKARWISCGKYYTSSGVSAGMDMILGFVADRFGQKKSEAIARHIEYIWNDDPNNDIFV